MVVLKNLAVLLLLLLLTQANANAFTNNSSEAQSIKSKPTVYFHVKPSLCLKTQGVKHCKMPFFIEFSQTPIMDFCLYLSTKAQADKRKKIHCWTQTQQGSLEFSTLIIDDIRLLLAANQHSPAFAVELVKVHDYIEPQKRKSRKLKHIWSLF